MLIHCGRCGRTFATAADFELHNPHEAETPIGLKLRILEGQRGYSAVELPVRGPRQALPKVPHTSHVPTARPRRKPRAKQAAASAP